MAKLFIADPLNKLLTAWEDSNIYADFLFNMKLLHKSVDEETSSYIGSEVKMFRFL